MRCSRTTLALRGGDIVAAASGLAPGYSNNLLDSDDLTFTRELNHLSEIRPHLRARLQNSSLQAQLSAAAAGFGLCVLPACVARTAPELAAVLPEQVSLRRAY